MVRGLHRKKACHGFAAPVRMCVCVCVCVCMCVELNGCCGVVAGGLQG